MREFFAKKGYKLIDSFDENTPDVIIGPDGTRYDADTMYWKIIRKEL